MTTTVHGIIYVHLCNIYLSKLSNLDLSKVYLGLCCLTCETGSRFGLLPLAFF